MNTVREHPHCDRPQLMGESKYVIWSMSYDWDDRKGKPIDFEKANFFGSFSTYEAAQQYMSTLTVDDENWSDEPKSGYSVIYWIWRDTPMMQHEVIKP